MWQVFFEDVEVFSSKSDVEALQFALSLHQASNVSHKIQVEDFSDVVDSVKGNCICTLIRK